MNNEEGKISPLTLKQNMFWNSAGSLINLIGQWLITVLIVRISSGYDAAGLLSLAMTVYGIFSPIAQYRMYTYQVSDVKNENSTGEYMAFRLLTSSIALFLCAGYSLLSCPIDAVLPIIVFGVYKTISSLIDVLHATDQRFLRMDYIGKSLALQGILSFVIFVVVFYLTKNLSLTLIVMAVFCMFVGVFYDLPHTMKFGEIKIGISRKKAGHLLIMCAPMVVGSILMAAAPSVPRQYLFAELGEAMLGIYGSVSAPVAIIQMGASYVYNPLMGYFADFYENKNVKEFFKLLAKSSFAILGIGLTCGAALMLLGGPLLNFIFGNSIDEYIGILPLIIVSAILIAYMGFLNDLLITFRYLRGTLIGGGIAFIASGVTTVPAVNLFGMNGISIALIASSVVSSLAMLYFVRSAIKRIEDRS